MSDQTMFMVINLCVHKYEWQKPCYKLLYLLLHKSRTPRWGHKVHRGRGNTRALHRGQISKSVSESGDIETEHRPSVAPERVQIHCLHVELCLLLREYLMQAPHHQMLWRRGGRDGFQWQQPGGAPRHRLSGGAEEVCGRVGLVWSVPGRGPQRDELHPGQ